MTTEVSNNEFTWDGNYPLSAIELNSSVVSTTTNDPVNRKLLSLRSVNSLFYHYSLPGSVNEISDSGQFVIGKFIQNSFGESLFDSGMTNNSYRFIGSQYYSLDYTQMLYYLVNRYYHPQLGRFLSKDPIGIDMNDANQYVYARNNPVYYTDPLGLEAEFWVCCVYRRYPSTDIKRYPAEYLFLNTKTCKRNESWSECCKTKIGGTDGMPISPGYGIHQYKQGRCQEIWPEKFPRPKAVDPYKNLLLCQPEVLCSILGIAIESAPGVVQDAGSRLIVRGCVIECVATATQWGEGLVSKRAAIQAFLSCLQRSGFPRTVISWLRRRFNLPFPVPY